MYTINDFGKESAGLGDSAEESKLLLVLLCYSKILLVAVNL